MSKSISEIYPKLYHYTTYEGLSGILETQNLWATNYQFLNDALEIQLFKNRLRAALTPIIIEHVLIQHGFCSNFQQILNERISEVVDGNYKITGHEFYITSFCGQHSDAYSRKNGLLSQWRGYGGDGGYAIVFDTAKLKIALEPEAKFFNYQLVSLTDVFYDDNTYEEKFYCHLREVAKFTIEMLSRIRSGRQDIPSAEKAYPSIINCMSRLKHQGFKEENEVRIVVYAPLLDEKYIERNHEGKPKPNKEIKTRLKNGQKATYIELKANWPIEQIIVGPHKNKEERAAQLKERLKGKNIEILISETPFV